MLIKNAIKPIWGYKFILYPYLISLYSLIDTLSVNVLGIPLVQSVRAIMVVLSTTTLFLIISFIITKNLHRATLISALIVFLIFSYGKIYRLLQNYQIYDFNLGQHYIILPIFALVIATVAISYIKLPPTKAEQFSNLILLIMTIALILPIMKIFVSFAYIGNTKINNWELDYGSSEEISSNNDNITKDPPDIYYLILDGYGREDTLDEIYGIDNSKFLDFLEDRNFYIAENSHTNYLQTALSLASSLNFMHLTSLNTNNANSADREPIQDLIAHSNIRSILDRYGYKFIAFDSGYSFTEIHDADLFLGPFFQINEFEELIFIFSIFIILDDFDAIPIPFYTYNTHRTRILFTLDQLKSIPQIPGPKFVFAHLVIPHPPFSLDSQGNPITINRAYDIHDANLFTGSRSEYINGYTEQVEFTNNQIEKIVDAILNSSNTPPIIIIQGDHGPRRLTRWESIESSCIKEAASILNAYYLPGSGSDWLYPSITPVNTFRIILNTYFNTDLMLLEDRTYFSNFARPYNFVDVTELLNNACEDTGGN